jgi:glycine/D-amino acid oxidase-like deaminating enzyme
VPDRHARNAQARPTTDRSRAEVVVGGGVVGCAAARSLAVDHDPLLVERDRLAGEEVPFPQTSYRPDRFESRSDGF